MRRLVQTMTQVKSFTSAPVDGDSWRPLVDTTWPTLPAVARWIGFLAESRRLYGGEGGIRNTSPA
jgi:hypothetical protein